MRSRVLCIVEKTVGMALLSFDKSDRNRYRQFTREQSGGYTYGYDVFMRMDFVIINSRGAHFVLGGYI